MSHPLLEHYAVLALCRRAQWIGDWRDLCGVARHEFDQERWNADGGAAKLLASLGPEPKTYDQKSRADYWDKRREILKRYALISIEKKIRIPPLPFHSVVGGTRAPEGCCRVCGQPVYKGRSWKRSAGPRTRSGSWHAICFSAYSGWVKADTLAGWLSRRQGGLCAYSGVTIAQWAELHPHDWRRRPNPYPNDARWRRYKPTTHEWRLLPDVEVDHLIPLWKVSRMVVSWPRVLNYWGPGNLRAVTGTAHKAKSRREAGERARLRLELADQGEFYV